MGFLRPPQSYEEEDMNRARQNMTELIILTIFQTFPWINASQIVSSLWLISRTLKKVEFGQTLPVFPLVLRRSWFLEVQHYRSTSWPVPKRNGELVFHHLQNNRISGSLFMLSLDLFISVGSCVLLLSPVPQPRVLFNFLSKTSIYSRCTTWWFDTHSKMIITVQLINIFSHRHHFFLLRWKHVKSSLLTNFQYSIQYY